MPPPADPPADDRRATRIADAASSRRTFLGAAAGAGLAAYAATQVAAAGHDLPHEERTAKALTQTDATPTTATAMQRADELLRQMTVEEKAMQLSAVIPTGLLGLDGPIRDQLEAQLGQGIGHISGFGLFTYKTPEQIAKTVNAIQRYLVDETRLGIPAIFHNEALNGVVSRGFSHFPTAIGLAATWDPAGVEKMADIMRRQMRSVGLLQALSPVMDVARDARWGRVHETYGEDPYLVSAMSVAFTRGIQATTCARVCCRARSIPRLRDDRGRAEHGRHRGRRARALRRLRPSLRGIHPARRVGIGDGLLLRVRRRADPHLPPDPDRLLRGQMGFTGTVVSDYFGVGWAQTRQLATATPEEAGALALEAGMDVELPAIYGYGPVLAQAVKTGACPSPSWTSQCAGCCATSSPSASSTTPMSPRTPPSSMRWRARAMSCLSGLRPSQ